MRTRAYLNRNIAIAPLPTYTEKRSAHETRQNVRPNQTAKQKSKHLQTECCWMKGKAEKKNNWKPARHQSEAGKRKHSRSQELSQRQKCQEWKWGSQREKRRKLANTQDNWKCKHLRTVHFAWMKINKGLQTIQTSENARGPDINRCQLTKQNIQNAKCAKVMPDFCSGLKMQTGNEPYDMDQEWTMFPWPGISRTIFAYICVYIYIRIQYTIAFGRKRQRRLTQLGAVKYVNSGASFLVWQAISQTKWQQKHLLSRGKELFPR